MAIQWVLEGAVLGRIQVPSSASSCVNRQSARDQRVVRAVINPRGGTDSPSK